MASFKAPLTPPNLAGRLLAVMRDHPAASLRESVAILRNQAGTAIPGVDLPVIR